MKSIFYPLIALLLLTLSAFAFYHSGTLKMRKDYSIVFSSEDVSGTFGKLEGTIVFDESHLEQSLFDLKVEVASINTGNNLKNKHARDEHWFDARKFPLITFKSGRIERDSSGYKAIGELSMHGITREATIPFVYSKNEGGGLFHASFQVDRTDFGVGKPDNKVSTVMNMEVSIPVTEK